MPAAYGRTQQNSWRSRQTYSLAKQPRLSGRCGGRQAPFPSLWRRSTIPSSKGSFRAWRIRAGTSLASCSLISKWWGSGWRCSKRPSLAVYLHSFEAVPRSVAVEVTAAPVRNTAEVEETIAKLGREPGGGLIVAADAFTLAHYPLLIRLAQQHRLPAVYAWRASVAQGALMSYGPDVYDLFRRSASYVDRILKGAKPADLPVQQPTKFELAINLKTAKALGLTIPDRVLAIADEVIE